MFNKLSANCNKRRFYNNEDEPPDKKLISDGDILIKQLAEKQRNTKVTLNEQLSTRNQFYKSTEVVSVTSYTSGAATLEEFNSVLQHLNDVEKLKSSGLTQQEIVLFDDYRNGKECMKDKHKNINESVLETQLQDIFDKIKESENVVESESVNCDRLNTETILATKPTSVETKLLKFALDNEHQNKEKISGPMDQIKDVEQQLLDALTPPNIKKIRKKARSLSKQINTVGVSTLKEPNIKNLKADDNLFCGNTKWDLKECSEDQPTEKKVFTCKPQNYYTIKAGKIIKIDPPGLVKSYTDHERIKLSIEEIKKLPKFENYDKGEPSRVLYVKNLANGLQVSDLHDVLGEFSQFVMSINIMKGRMRGQAFMEFQDEDIAEKVLDQCNGTLLKNKPIVIQFGKNKGS